MGTILYFSILAFILVASIIIYLIFKRNYFNKYKYIRLVKYNDNMTISVQYIKKGLFNIDKSILINPKHIYNYNGYISIIITSKSCESINPIDFESKFDVKNFKSAIKSKLISETFASMKAEKFDKVMALIFLNILQLIAIAYLLYTFLGGSI